MKRVKVKKTPSIFAKALLVLTPVLAFNAFANDEAILKSDPINIEGYVKAAPRVTDNELESISNELVKQKNEIQLNKAKTKKYQKLQRTTVKLADETETYLEEKNESQKVIEEYNKKIKCLLEKKNTKECRKNFKSADVQDSVNTKAAAVAKNEAKAEPTKRPLGIGELKVIPYSGMTMINADNGQLESGLVAGVKAEANIGSSFSFGVGFNYTNLENTDFCLIGSECFGAWSGSYSPYGSNQIGREQKYSKYSVGAYGKFFPLKNDRFRPYVGAGVNYSRSSLNYTSNNQSAYYNVSHLNANEEVEMTTFAAEVSLGTEIRFTKMFGMNLEVQYAKAMSTSINNNNPFSQYVPGQQRLSNLAEDIENADNVSVFAGLLVTF
ncbi:porin family protein [Bacteriovoracaceae bacterium]|nr:porin family protein [Bacteriovoracaceae bacterium]